MKRAWVGLALLSGSWLAGFSLYGPPRPVFWACCVLGAVLLLPRVLRRLPPLRVQLAGALAALPAALLLEGPVRAVPWLLMAGVALEALPIPRRWPARVGRGAVAAAGLLLVQRLTLALYVAQTARSHDLPWPFPQALAALVRLAGLEATARDATVVVHSLREMHPLAATWDLLVDPASVGFLTGGLALLALAVAGRTDGSARWRCWLRASRRLALVVGLWLPLRAVLLIAVFFQRELVAHYGEPLLAMNHLFSPWMGLALLSVPVFLAWRFVTLPAEGEPADALAQTAGAPRGGRFPAAVGLTALAVAALALAIYWEPVGRPMKGRVMVVERHSTWSPTTRPFGTTAYGEEASYNYGALYAYCGQFFTMARLLEEERIDAAALARCDVLVVKIPTARYSRKEVDAIERFVARGGGLLLVGDHTNVFNHGTYLNDIARRFGFTFRHDLLFGFAKPSDEWYVPPQPPHPAVLRLRGVDFAVSDSIDPGTSRGRAAIVGTGLWSLPPDYHVSNYFPVPQFRADMRCGAFIQLWAARHGQGRVAAFTDSTIFSNFSLFEPGKTDLFLGMLHWLNHRGGPARTGWVLVPLGLAALAGACWLARGRRGGWMALMGAALGSYAVSVVAIDGLHRWALPSPKLVRPLPCVKIDRAISEASLAKGGFVAEGGKGYGLLEQALPRLGLVVARANGEESFSGQGLIVLEPTRSVSDAYRERLVRYVAEGGKLLVIDSPENGHSTANSLLWPFGLSIERDPVGPGVVRFVEAREGSAVEQKAACGVSGGEPVARMGEEICGARVRYGKGSVIALGFAPLWNDAAMGWQWDVVPKEDALRRYEALFAVVRGWLDGEKPKAESRADASQPVTRHPPPATQPPTFSSRGGRRTPENLLR